MSEQEFEVYLRLLGRFLRLTDAQRGIIGRELRSHMEDRLDELIEQGFTREDAINTILDEFGDAAALGSEFGRIGRRRKWIMRTTAGTIGIAAAIVLIVSFLLPENRPLSAPPYSLADDRVMAFASDDPIAVESHAATRPAATAQPAAPVMASPDSDTDRKARARLAEIMPTIEFPEGTSFEETLNFFRENSELSVDVNWNALGVLGIDRSTDTLGLHLRQIKFETVLDFLLDNVGGPEANIDYVIQDGVVRISTKDDLDRKTILRIYDCADLIRRPLTDAQQAMARSLLRDVLSPASEESPSSSGGGGFGRYGGGAPPTASQVLAQALLDIERENANALVDLIKTTVSPDTWEPDGALGSLKEYDGMLVVVHSLSAHSQLTDMLTMLRQVRAAREPQGSDAGCETTESVASGQGFQTR